MPAFTYRRRQRMADRAERPADLGKWTSMAKLFASDNAMKVTVEAIQVLGGYGTPLNGPRAIDFDRDGKFTEADGYIARFQIVHAGGDDV